MSVEKFWATRAEKYDHLEWVYRNGYLQAFVKAGGFQGTDRVLDVGTGTGVVAHATAPLVHSVVGIDTSPEMLARAEVGQAENETFEGGNVCWLRWPDDWFDKVTARMVFHHLVDDNDLAMSECYRVLKPGGMMVFSEGVPPHYSLRQWFTDMFALKEDRLTYSRIDMECLMLDAGFDIVRVIEYVVPHVSIGNWLRASGLPRKQQAKIMEMHRHLNEAGQRHYNMVIADEYILCDFTFVIVVGCK